MRCGSWVSYEVSPPLSYSTTRPGTMSPPTMSTNDSGNGDTAKELSRSQRTGRAGSKSVRPLSMGTSSGRPHGFTSAPSIRSPFVRTAVNRSSPYDDRDVVQSRHFKKQAEFEKIFVQL